MRVYPFPDKTGSREELKRDILYQKIPAEDLDAISDRAWDTGAAAAQALLLEHPSAGIYEVARAEGLTVEHRKVDKVSGKVRYFSEYYAGRKTIFLYDESVKRWADANGVPRYAAEELILAHEIFHHLECTRLGLTSRQYTVPALRLGPICLGKSGIRALSEIGAHGFSYTWYQARGKLPGRQRPDSPELRNHAVNQAEFQGKKTAEKLFEDNPIRKLFLGRGGT